jgi:choline-sulfatase
MGPRISMARSMAMLVGLIATACAHAQVQPKSVPRPARPNAILITVDTLRADYVGAFGAKKVTTPAIDSLSRDGLLYENAIAPVPLTLASHSAMLTGTYPFYNGVQDFTGEPLASNFQTVAQAFKRNGYSTAAFVSSFVLDRSWGLARGFDYYYDAFKPESFVQKNIGLVDRPAGETITSALAWLQKRDRQKPFFLWIHLYDPHTPYAPPEPFRTRLSKDLYAGEVAYVDSELSRFFSTLKKAGLYDRSAIVLLSDHGESLGEHGEAEHGFFVYRATTHVPLVVKPVRSPQKNVRISSAVEGIAVAPTLLKLVGIRDLIVKQFQTGSLPLSLNEAQADSTAYSETYYPFSSFGWSPLRSLQTTDYQFIDAPIPELYNHLIDPKQQSNQIKDKQAIASVLQQKLRALADRFPAPQRDPSAHGVSEETAARLRALGYVAYKSPVSADQIAKGLPDPKTKVQEFTAILQAGDAFQAGRFEQGRSLLEQVRASDPEMYLVPFMLGEAALRQRDWETGVAEFARCLKLNPQFDQAMTGSAQALAQLGRLEEAKQKIQAALQVNPQNYRALYQLGFMQVRTDPDAATAAFEKVLSIQPNFALAHRDLAIVRFSAKDYARALEHFESAARLGIEDKQLFNSAGIAASQVGKRKLAISHYKRALELDKDYADAHLNLALAYQQSGHSALAKAEYATACRLQPGFCRFVPQ